MPSEKPFREIRKALESAGWVFMRVTGSHHIFTRPGHQTISIPVHAGKVKPRYVRIIEKEIKAAD
ncbi:MAG: type II toxin-antitoxin system HicA family toxin [Phycisphaeraceae bacterium]